MWKSLMKSFKLSFFLIIIASLFLHKFYNDATNRRYKFCVTSLNDQSPPEIQYDPELSKFTTPGNICIEDIVKYVNIARAGDDQIVGTNDDRLNLEEQINLLEKIVIDLFPGDFWVLSPWHFNHNSCVTGQVKILYADFDEYLILYGSKFEEGGYTGSYYFDIWDFILEGFHYTQKLGKVSKSLAIPQTNLSSEKLCKKVENSTKFVPHLNYLGNSKSFVYLPSNVHKQYRNEGSDGSYMLEYARGFIVTSFFSSLLLPTVFLTSDYKSLYTAIRYYLESVIKNTVLYMFFDMPKAH